jgi:RimJ/RimL family protein N-acetyltransferase
MLHVFRNILKFVDHHTYGELLNRLWCTAARPFYENNARYIFRLNVSSAIDPDPNLTIEELSVADINEMLDVMYVSRAGLEKRFGWGDRCFAVIDKNKFISYFWAQFGLRDIRELHLKFELSSSWAWMYNAITVKTARGRGLYPNIIRYMAKALSQSGIEECFIDVDPKNIPSIRGLEKAGCRKVVEIRMRKVFSKIICNATVFDKKAWQELSKGIRGVHYLRNGLESSPCQ